MTRLNEADIAPRRVRSECLVVNKDRMLGVIVDFGEWFWLMFYGRYLMMGVLIRATDVAW